MSNLKMSDDRLSVDGGWSIGEKSLAVILQLIEKERARKILEFGSGPSTVRLAMAFPEAVVHSIEHDWGYYQRTMGLLREFNASQNAEVFHCPLKWFWLGPRRFLTYELRRACLSRGYDFVIIDGPPAFTLRGREGALYLAFSLLREGTMVILDDYQRDDEQQIVRNWMKTCGLRLESVIQVGHHLAVLRVPAKEWSIKKWLVSAIYDNYYTYARGLYGRYRRRATHLAGRVLGYLWRR